MGRATRYDEDFYAWTQEQAAALRRAADARLNADVDWANVAEEVEDMGKSDRRALYSRLDVLAVHLLKWLHCPELLDRCARQWRLTIVEQRKEIAGEFDFSPSLRKAAAERWSRALRDARRQAAIEAEVPITRFPRDPAISLAEALDDAFPPDLFPPDVRDDG
jgi:hypothetical protein